MATPTNILAVAVLCCLAGCAAKNVAPAKHARTTTQPLVQFPPMAPRMPALPRYIEPGQRTVDDVLADFGPYVTDQLKPYFQRAGIAYPPREITLLALKREMKLELWARDDGPYRLVRGYDIRAASGTSGPKLRQGDRQVPEGIYRIAGLNPNSNYHLSLKLNYPNDFDLYHADLEGRSEPGSDIFIHGKAVSIGCLAMGDEAIEQLFVLAAHTGRENIRVVIAPHDPRVLPLDPNDADLPEWTPELYAMIERAVSTLAEPVQVSAKSPYLPSRGTVRR